MKNSWTAVMRLRTIVSSFVIATALIAGCSSGGDSGGGDTPPAASPISGKFIDSTVDGLHYTSPPSNPVGGVTTNGGQYQCMPGDSVTFDLGGRTIGTPQPCGPLTTAVSVFGATSVTDLRVVNLAWLLLTLGGPPNSDNVIQLPSPLPGNLPPTLPNFSDPTFATQLQTAGFPLTVSDAQAIAHLQTSFKTLSVTVVNSGTVTSSPGGIDCTAAGTCSFAFVADTVVTLTATGTGFTGWSGGGCSGAGTCMVTMNADAAVTANFGSGGGTLTVANAPAVVGGTFVADPQFTQTNVVAGLATVTWSELPALPGPHVENVGVALDLLTGQVLSLTMNEGVGLVFTSWQCALPPGFPCAGVTVSRATGTASITNTVLQDVGGTGAPPITLNGTLTFTPF